MINKYFNFDIFPSIFFPGSHGGTFFIAKFYPEFLCFDECCEMYMSTDEYDTEKKVFLYSLSEYIFDFRKIIAIK